ncbi:hypothetical protein [Pseudomonas sp. PMCC200344]|uniref:hypothetical protein n=1 Tax=Pseudomonas sp. PMCC200344 TaxID=3042028 RepID=UPI0024B34526|nr:hypothetical protein [Pseudomonas sp. PMCC200344]
MPRHEAGQPWIQVGLGLLEEGRLLAIREAKDASPQEVGFCNGGVMGLSGATTTTSKPIR